MPNAWVSSSTCCSSSTSRKPRPSSLPVAGQRVEVARRRELRGLQRELGRRAADHEREVVRRARRGAERAQLLVEPAHQRRRVEQRLRLLEQQALVGRAAALGHEQQLVRVAVDRLDLDLGRQVGAGVLLVVRGERRHLRVAQVVLVVGAEDAAGDRLAVAAAGQDELALLALDDRGAGVLARRAGCRPRRCTRSSAARSRRRGRWATPRDRRGSRASCARWPGRSRCAMSNIAGLGEQRQRLGLDLDEPAAAGLEGRDVVGGEQPVRRVVGADRQAAPGTRTRA